MTVRVLLCIDSPSLSNPSLAGLPDESLERFSWLACETTAQRCRSRARTLPEVEEVWVVSCDDMDPINIAATLKRDAPSRKVYLVSFGGSGSLSSRAARAHLDGILSESLFVRRYAQVKKVLETMSPSASSAPEETTVIVPKVGCEASASSEADAGDSGRVSSPDEDARFFSRSGAFVPAGRELAVRGPSRFSTEGSSVVITVVSGSGGSGKSTIAALFALLCLRAGIKTAVLDADLQFGDMDYLLGVSEPIRIDDIAVNDRLLEGISEQPQADRPALVAAPRKLEMSEVAAPVLPTILERLRESFEVIVVNTGACWSDAQASVLEASDTTIFTMDARPSALRANVHAIELCARLGVATTGFTFVVNRHERTSLLSAVDVACALRGARAHELPYGGRDVDELLGAGCPEELIASRNPFVESLRALLVEILPEEKRSLMKDEGAPPRRRRLLFSRGGRQ